VSGAPSPEEIVALQETLYTSRNPTRRWLHLSRKAWIERAIAQRGPGERALEVGPGSGVYLPALSAAFESVTASDVEPAHLERLGPLFPEVDLIRDDITNSALDRASYDLVLCSEVIEHIPDSRSALSSIWGLLKPGGTLILSTPQRFSTLEVASKVAFLPGIVQVVRRIYREPVLKQGHINLMTARTVRAQLVEAGLQPVEEYLGGVYLPLLAEMTGRLGLRIAQTLEPLLRSSPLRWLLWTQYHVARKAVALHPIDGASPDSGSTPDRSLTR